MPQAPSTFTVSVFTRHSSDCSNKNNPQWKRCECSKSVYIYESGKKHNNLGQNPLMGQAEKFAQAAHGYGCANDCSAIDRIGEIPNNCKVCRFKQAENQPGCNCRF